MDGKDSKSDSWRVAAETREHLISLLLTGQAGTYQPHFTPEQAITALVEARAAYFDGEAILKDEAAIGKQPPTVATVIRLLDDALHALKRLEDGADSDTLALVGHSKAFPSDVDHFAALGHALADRRDELTRHRKTDSRTETRRVLCGYVSAIWQAAAHEPDNRTSRRRFAIVFLDAASIDHPGVNHPDALDDWLDTPVGPPPQS